MELGCNSVAEDMLIMFSLKKARVRRKEGRRDGKRRRGEAREGEKGVKRREGR